MSLRYSHQLPTDPRQDHHQHRTENQHMQYKMQSMANRPPPLPPGWIEAKDPSSGKTYFANPTTRETQWDRPIATAAVATATSQHPMTNPATNPNWNVQNRVPASTAQSQHTIRTDQQTRDDSVLHTVFSSAGSNAAFLQPEELVMASRQMLETAQAFPDQTISSDLELHSVTPGQIAYLCKLQHRIHQQTQQDKQQRPPITEQDQQKSSVYHRSHHQNWPTFKDETEEETYQPLPPYTPINPFNMPVSGPILYEHIEPGRLDVRMNSLRRDLKAYGYHQEQGL